MSRHTKRSSDTGFAALTIEGGLIALRVPSVSRSSNPQMKENELTRPFLTHNVMWGLLQRRKTRWLFIS